MATESSESSERELLCPMKDAAEEERAAGINRLKEGDFGRDLPLVLRACGFTQLELPAFGQLQSEEVMALSASIVANPRNFDAWIALMKLVETSGTDGEKRELYEHFLSEFPLCWGYWKRLADLQTRTCGSESGLNVYVKALKLAPACVDLWVHYCQAAASADGAEDGLRELFEKAVETVGSDWRAFPLWDLYMNFEEKNRRWKRLGSVLRRAMVVPMEGLPAVRIRLRALVLGDAAPPLEELCCDDAESNQLDVESNRTQSYDPQVRQVMTVSLAEHVAVSVAPVAPVAPAAVESEEELEEGEVVEEGEILDEPSPPVKDAAPPADLGKPETLPPAAPLPSVSPEPAPEPAAKVDDPKNTKTPGKKTKFITDRAQRFLQMREELWAAASEEASLLRTFEAPLHRHYFHQKVLSSAQLDAWRRFLDFEESREPRDWRRLQGLFGRCLIVANNYLEFWLRYASVLEQAEAAHGQNKPEISCGLLRGACLSGRLSRRPDALAAWAELEESCGRVDRARVLLDATLSGCGHGSSDLALRRASLELRYQDAELAAVLLERYANDAVDLASKAVLSRRYARLCEDRLHQVDKACQSLLSTWQAGCRDVGLLLELTSLLVRFSRGEQKGSTGLPLRQSCLLFEEALRCLANDAGAHAHVEAPLPEACELWSCYVDFLLANGAPLSQLRDVQARARAFRSQASVRKADAENRKRGLPGPTASCKQAKLAAFQTAPGHLGCAGGS